MRSRSIEILRPGGVLVSIVGDGGESEDRRRAAERGVSLASLMVEADRSGMPTVAGLAATGALRAHVETTFPLGEAAAAHARGETGRTTGKIVLVVR